MVEEKGKEQRLFLPITVSVLLNYSAGTYVGKFLEKLRDEGKLYGNKCPKCGRMVIPPRIVCGRCHVRMGEWVELSDKGTVIMFTVVEQDFWDCEKADFRKAPYTHGIILLDGATVPIQHFLEETNVEKIRIGMRVQAVFKPKEKRQGHILDIIHFKTIEE